MQDKTNPPSSIDEYIAGFPPEIQEILTRIRAIIHEAAPGASEKISYQMPTLFFHGNLVHFAAYKNHIGFYPTPAGIEKFAKELSPYKTSKGAIQFPLNQSIPYDLIRAITAYRYNTNQLKTSAIKGI